MQLHDAGMEVMNHSDTHAHFAKLSSDEIAAEINACSDKIEALTGVRPTLFRCPYGEYDDHVIDTVNAMGVTAVQWDVDSLDWKEYGKEEMIERVLKHSQLQNGAILLFHNNTKYTAQALDAILTGLEEQGYHIGTVSDRILKEGGYIDSQGRQHPSS